MITYSQKGALAALIALLVVSCYYEDIPRPPDLSVCLGTDLSVSAIPQSTTGCGKTDGSITASATGGSGDYTYSKDDGKTKQQSGSFTGLAGGTYLIIVYDGSSCTDSTEATVNIANTNFQASVKSVIPDTGCLASNGAVELDATGGTGSYSFNLGTITNATGIFSGIKGGAYTAIVTDATCSINVAVTVPSQGTTSYVTDIAPILTAKCNFSTCHGSGGPQTNFTIYNNVKTKASDIKLRTGNGNMPKQPKPGGSLSSDQIKLIACWVDDGAKNN